MKNSVLINMTVYGIQTVVQTKQEKIDSYMQAFNTEPDERLGGGVGKQNYFFFTWELISKEDKYFTLNPICQITERQRWKEFLEDCVIYATLRSFLTGEPIPVLSDDSEIVIVTKEIDSLPMVQLSQENKTTH